MDIQALQAFISVAEHGSFSRAGEALYLSQPAVSKRIAALESELDALLFDRIGRRIHLTEAGEALLPRARRILLEVADSRRALSQLSDRVAGTLHVGTSHHIGLRRLPPVLRSYTASFPEVELGMRFMDSERACQAVERGALELAVVTLPTEPPETLEVTEIWRDRLRVCVAPDHPLARTEEATLAELGRWPSVLPDHGTYTREIIETAFRDAGVALHPRLATNYMETIRMLVTIGLGWSPLPETMTGDDLVVLEPAGLRLERRLGVVLHRARSLSRAGAELVRLLEAESER